MVEMHSSVGVWILEPKMKAAEVSRHALGFSVFGSHLIRPIALCSFGVARAGSAQAQKSLF